MHAQLAIGVLKMCLDSVDGDAHVPCDLLVGTVLGEETQDTDLAIAERLCWPNNLSVR